MSFDDPMIFTSLLFGSMLPYAFSALTMKSVGQAALGMIEEVRRQIRTNPGILNGSALPDYEECIKISTQASLREMIMPGLLVNYICYFRLLLLLSYSDSSSALKPCLDFCQELLSVEFKWLFQLQTQEVHGITPRNTLRPEWWSKTDNKLKKVHKFTRPQLSVIQSEIH